MAPGRGPCQARGTWKAAAPLKILSASYNHYLQHGLKYTLYIWLLGGLMYGAWRYDGVNNLINDYHRWDLCKCLYTPSKHRKYNRNTYYVCLH